MSKMPLFDYWNRPSNQAFHDLTTTLTPPPNLRSLLGLGLKFIPTPFRPTSFNQLLQDDSGIPSLTRSLRLRCFFCAVGEPPQNMEHNLKLHVPSEWEPPPEFYPNILRNRMHNFAINLRKLFKSRRSIPNLSRTHRFALDYLQSQQDFIIAHCDKNLGPAIIERDKYVSLAFRDHLSDASTYQRLSKPEADDYARCNQNRVLEWLAHYKTELTNQECTYIQHHLNEVEDPLPYFYLLMKVHKHPLKTRPIVSFSGSLFHGLGVWVDTHLQQVAKSFESYLESSFDLLHDFKTLVLPPHCKLFTADATSMHANMPAPAAIAAIEKYITDNQAKFPLLPVSPLLEAIGMIMYHNVFQFGDTYWKQLSGTAMGAPPAPTYANASFATFEASIILPKYKSNLAYYKRYIDDVFGIWIPDPDPRRDAELWSLFQADLNSWHGLEWIVSHQSSTAVFSDVTLRSQDTTISSALFEKPMNLHLYLPARSAHPPGALQGLICGHIYRAYNLCSDEHDAISSIRKLWSHLRARGYSASTLHPIFSQGIAKRRPYVPPSSTPESTHPDYWFLKLRYHPQDPSSKFLQKAWNDSVATPRLSKPLSHIDIKFNPIGHRRFIVCYKRAPNLGNLLSYRKITPNSGPPVSSFCE